MALSPLTPAKHGVTWSVELVGIFGQAGAPLAIVAGASTLCSKATWREMYLMRRASWMSLGMMVTRLAWMAARLVSSKRPTR